MRAARYLGVSVEYTEERGVEFRQRALMAQGIEESIEAENRNEILSALMKMLGLR
jgi:hypothetical protein